MINIHASLLPKYRGAAPVHRAVINGDAETGVTHHARRHASSTPGPCLRGRAMPIGPDETTPEVERALAAARRDAGRRGRRSSSRTAAPPRRRRTTRARPTRRRSRSTKGRSTGRCRRPIHNLRSRAAAVAAGVARPSTACDADSSHRADRSDARPMPRRARSSSVRRRARGRRRRWRASLRILEIQPEGKRAMTARDFLAGHRVAAGRPSLRVIAPARLAAYDVLRAVASRPRRSRHRARAAARPPRRRARPRARGRNRHRHAAVAGRVRSCHRALRRPSAAQAGSRSRSTSSG